ncbi:hypothetical protein ACFO26_04665 [Lactococcus nasutitermitis]|uniref:Uncharacterized protein n=1 Tax=Lactococcus nasutitermitis TaxID=1652957 RepID=A0ABV9JE14_9LACT|nr:hypothetical protein [Lactococcus nasutitermitis]
MNTIKDSDFNVLQKFSAEYVIGTVGVLPIPRMKIRIYEEKERFIGYTDVQLRIKFDDSFELAVGFGKTEEEALQDTLKYFKEMIEENYPDLDELALNEKNINLE